MKCESLAKKEEIMESTMVFKQHLPHNTLYEVTNLRTVDGHGQTVFMDAKLVMQAVDQKATEEVEGIVTSNFTDFNGDEINDLIQCTAPRTIAKSWLTGGITKDHIDNTMLFMINESYDRDHKGNKIHDFNYQYYFGAADLTVEVIEALKEEGTVDASKAFKAFFVSCLGKSAEFKKRNEEYCNRYKPQRVKKRALSRVFHLEDPYSTRKKGLPGRNCKLKYYYRKNV